MAKSQLDDNDLPRFGTVLKYGLLVVFAVCIIGVATSWFGMFTSVATAPARVVSRTMQTDNIINNYEWFHDVNAQYKTRRAQISEFQKRIDGEQDAREKSRLNMELSAMRQTCRDLATRYNANAIKSNRSIFMGKEAPESLNMEGCG